MTKKHDVTETVDFTKKTDIVKNVTDKTDTAINITEKIEVVSEKTDSTAETTVTPQPSGSSVVARDFLTQILDHGKKLQIGKSVVFHIFLQVLRFHCVCIL